MNLARFWRLMALLESEYADLSDTLTARIERAREYVDERLHRAEVVASLPAEAPGGKLLVTANDPNLYVGAGAGRPLRKIPTEPV